MLKGLHLLAALFIICILVLYFQIKYHDSNIVVHPQDDEQLSIAGLYDSPYKEFCANNKDVNCGSISNFITDSYDKEEYGKVILNEKVQTTEKIEEVSNFISTNNDINIHPENMNKLLEHIYEEKLPEDIIDENNKTEPEKNKNIKIIPAKKPPYFGKKKAVVIVIDDMGISLKRTADISSLKSQITASFLTYGQNLDKQIQKPLY
jgi:hypothetical protein